MKQDLFNLDGRNALLIGKEGNFGPIFKKTLEDAGCEVFAVGLPEVDISNVVEINEICHFYRDIVPDIVVCNAALDIPPSVKNARFFTEFSKILSINLTSYSHFAKNLIPKMKNGGVFVFIGSIQGYIGADWRNYAGGFEKPVAYNVSKAGLQQLARSITVQYGKRGIRAVCPGFGPYLGEKLRGQFAEKIKKSIPMQRGIDDDDLKRTLLYACCCENLAGEDWLVDGGYTKW